MLYLDQYQNGLLEAEVLALREQAKIYAGALGESAVRETRADDPVLVPDLARPAETDLVLRASPVAPAAPGGFASGTDDRAQRMAMVAPYIASPTQGWRCAERWTRIWCMRPVSGRASTRAATSLDARTR